MVAPALGADLRADTSDIHPPQMCAELVVMQGAAAAGLVIAYKRILGREGGGSGSDTPSYFRGFAVVRA